MTFADCYTHAASIFTMGETSIHGPAHWRRVERFVIRIASKTEGADMTVCRLFAIYHDSCRLNDGSDSGHGPRAAEMLRRYLPSTTCELDADRLALLIHAVANHTAGFTSDNPTIGACWDADRLDLVRINMQPHPRYMSTLMGKTLARATSTYSPTTPSRPY